jgi:hypothetical protein
MTSDKDTINNNNVVPTPIPIPKGMNQIIKVGPKSKAINKEKDEGGLYEYAVITDYAGTMLWILARDVKIFKKLYEKTLIKELEQMGFKDTYNRPWATYQGKECQYQPYAKLNEPEPKLEPKPPPV